MSLCRFKKDPTLRVPPPVLGLELVLVLDNFTAQFVSNEQYQQLLFILLQNPNAKFSKFALLEQTFLQNLLLFNSFDTHIKYNFQDMIYKFLFPFIYIYYNF